VNSFQQQNPLRPDASLAGLTPISFFEEGVVRNQVQNEGAMLVFLHLVE